MQVLFTDKDATNYIEQLGIDFSFLSLFSNLNIEKQHKILLAYLKAVQIAMHPDQNPDFSEVEREKVSKLFNKLNELKDFDKFTEQLRLFKSSKSKLMNSINEVKRERTHFAKQWRWALKEVELLRKERNELFVEIKKIKQFNNKGG